MEPDGIVQAAEDLLSHVPRDALRAARGELSCQDIAAKAGLTRQAISAYEKGSRRPTGVAAYRYARALGLLEGLA